MDMVNVNFALYDDGNEYLGLASVALPALANKIENIEGAGLAGEIEAIIPHLNAMDITINFRTTTEQAIRLSEIRRHNIDLRIAQEHEDPVNNNITYPDEKHYMVIIPKTHNLGSIAPSSPSNGSGEYTVRYWKTWLNGKEVREVDPMNMIYKVNGVDYLADVRKALGK